MNDYLAESRGTLARTAQKKQTAISQYHRQQQLRKKEEKYGFAVRPSNPNMVDRPDAIEFYFKEVYGETSNKVSQLLQLDAAAIDREGEGPIRRMNKDVHELILERARWGRRFVEVGGHVPQEQLKPATKMQYFGAAKFLPEAVKAAAASGDAEKDEDEEDAFIGGGVDDMMDGEDGVAQQAASQPTPTVSGDQFDDDNANAPTKTTRWLSLSPQSQTTSATAVIQGFTGLEFVDAEERRLRPLEAAALQKARKLIASFPTKHSHGGPSSSSGASILAETANEDDNDYNPELAKPVAHHRQLGSSEEDGGDDGQHRQDGGGDHLNDVAARLLGMQVLQYNHQAPSEEDIVGKTTQKNSNTAIAATTTLPSEKEVQARVFAAKKAMMLQQLNNRKKAAVGGGGGAGSN